MDETIRKVVVAYSGGLDTSVIVPWLRETYDCEVIAVVADVGQGSGELEGIEAKARASGASSCHVLDLRERFVEDYAYPTLLSGALYEGRYLLGTAIARPIIAKAMAQVALEVGADAIAHGCTGKGNDQVRFETAFARFAPQLKVIAPWRQWKLESREDLLNYLRERGIHSSASVEKIYSRDANLWHISHEGGELENPWNAPPEDMWTMTTAPELAPDMPETVTVGFEAGRARTVDGVAMPAHELVGHLNGIAGRHGVGRVDIIENRLVGMKSRGCYETPGGTVLFEALRALEEIVLDRETHHFRTELGHRFGRIVYDGQWFTPVRRSIAAALETIAAPLTGEVVVKLYKGTATPVSRRSPNALYDEQYATFGASAVYEHKHAEGFIRLFSLPSRITAGREHGMLDETVSAMR